jgi:hypothetical protein
MPNIPRILETVPLLSLPPSVAQGPVRGPPNFILACSDWAQLKAKFQESFDGDLPIERLQQLAESLLPCKLLPRAILREEIKIIFWGSGSSMSSRRLPIVLSRRYLVRKRVPDP